MTADPTTGQIVGFVIGLLFTALWLVGCICYAHCRGDAEMGVSDTQGRETEAGSGEHGAQKTEPNFNPQTK